jgi:hypothetical protein
MPEEDAEWELKPASPLRCALAGNHPGPEDHPGVEIWVEMASGDWRWKELHR